METPNVVKSFYNLSGGCLRLNGDICEWCEINVGVRKGYVTSTLLFNYFMDGMLDKIKGRWSDYIVQMLSHDETKWEQPHWWYTHVLSAESEEQQGRMVGPFAEMC